MDKPYRVFYSYSHKDEEYLKELKEHIAPLRQSGLIVDWYDRMIPAGSSWEPRIAQELEEADIFLMLISSSFLNSNYCFNVEMNKALQKAEMNDAIAIPIIIRECLWEFTKLKSVQCLPTDCNPIQTWHNRDDAWKNVVVGLYNAMQLPNDKREKSIDLLGAPRNRSEISLIVQNLEITDRPEPLVLGREREIEYLVDKLEKARIPITITSGFGGIGKSTLALKIAWMFFKKKSLFNFIAFINCRTYGVDEKQGVSYDYILNDIARIADRNDIASNTNLDAKEEQLKDMIRSYKALLIFDNYESLLQYPEVEQRTSKFINSLPTGSVRDRNSFVRVIVTTRELSEGLKALPKNNLDVERMPIDACVKWMKQIKPQNINLNDAQYRKIWKMLHGLPKYIELVVMDHLKTTPFDDWERENTELLQNAEPAEIFNDLFEQSWIRFDEHQKKILMSMSYFIGDAPYKALRYTSGLAEAEFYNVLNSIPSVYIESTGSKLRTHPLTSAYCHSKLNSKEYAGFRLETQNRFIDYYQEFAEKSTFEKQENEIRNIIAAVDLAKNLRKWEPIIAIKDKIEIRHRGYWYEQLELSKYAEVACEALGREKDLAELRVFDIGWLYLRFEEIEEAIDVVNKGLKTYKKLDDKKGISQANRHLGKASLIKGLDDFYVPTNEFDKYSLQAQDFYQISLDIRETLEKEGEDQKQAIADMYLDFGRLYWLQGVRYGKLYDDEKDLETLSKSLQKCRDALEISMKAQSIFEKIQLERGIVKSWGNLGNASKEIVRYALRLGDLEMASHEINKAHEYYVKNAEGGDEIKRVDEIAHGYWGLAEIYKLYAENHPLHNSVGEKNALLRNALRYASESNKIYASLGGTKDINATRALRKDLENKIHSDKKQRRERKIV